MTVVHRVGEPSVHRAGDTGALAPRGRVPSWRAAPRRLEGYMPGSLVIPSFLAPIDFDTHIQYPNPPASRYTSCSKFTKLEYKRCLYSSYCMVCPATVEELLFLPRDSPPSSTA
jgi:hypothetical protein